MKKYIFFFSLLILTLGLSSCDSADPNKLDYIIDEISIIDDTAYFMFSVDDAFFETAKPSDFGYYYFDDLPDRLAPTLITLSKGEDVIECYSEFFPVECIFDLDTQDGDLSQFDDLFTLRLEFKDGSFAHAPLLLPAVEIIKKPEISSPTLNTDDLNVLTFKNVGKLNYEILLAPCYDYANDGINPCLNDAKYILSPEGKLTFDYGDEKYINAQLISMDDEIQIKFDMDLSDYDSIFYNVTVIEEYAELDEISVYRAYTDFVEIFFE